MSLDPNPKSPVILTFCATCGQLDSAELTRKFTEAALPGPVSLRFQPCLNSCANPSAMAIQSEGGATYFFAGIEPATDQADIIATLRAYVSADAGWIEDARECGRLRYCLVGRLPAL